MENTDGITDEGLIGRIYESNEWEDILLYARLRNSSQMIDIISQISLHGFHGSSYNDCALCSVCEYSCNEETRKRFLLKLFESDIKKTISKESTFSEKLDTHCVKFCMPVISCLIMFYYFLIIFEVFYKV
jgi:Fe2+ transport system protein B